MITDERKVVEAMALYEGFFSYDSGTSCDFCDGFIRKGAGEIEHDTGCPVLLARKLVKEMK